MKDKLIGERSAEPTDEALAIEVLARFTGNSRGTPIAKKAFIDGVLWARDFKAKEDSLPFKKFSLMDESPTVATDRTELKEDNKAFGEQDLREAFQAGANWQVGHTENIQNGWPNKRPTFKEWLKSRIEKQTI